MRAPRNGEVLLDDPDEMWLRPTFPSAVVDRGEVGWEAFRLRAEDKGELSGVRGSVSNAEDAERSRLSRAKAQGRRMITGGTWGVSVAQLTIMSLQCFDDTADVTKQNVPDGHAFVDMVGLNDVEARNKSIELAEAANQNGRLSLIDPATV